MTRRHVAVTCGALLSLIHGGAASAQTENSAQAGDAAAAVAAAAPAPAATRGLDIASLREGLAGTWTGKLEYRDYTAKEWFGIPMTVRIDAVGDGVTLIRHGEFDDGPIVGTVRITTVQMLAADLRTETVGMFRKGRAAELVTYTLSMPTAAADANNWTMVAETTSTDDSRPARLRETMTRTGATLTTLKEVDMLDDAGENWLVRNRTTLTRAAE